MTDSTVPRPELLLHPNIPKPLHGTNPRTILGQTWWNTQRKMAYARYNDRCWACGIHKSEAKYHKWLEAHEVYEIDYHTGRMEMTEICALCHSCHNYIHDFRLLKLLERRKIAMTKYIDILAHGEALLKSYLSEVAINYQGQSWKKPFEENQPFPYALPDVIVPNLPSDTPPFPQWQQWHLVLNGQVYYSRFSDRKEWSAYYLWLSANKVKDTEKAFAEFKKEYKSP
jgi:hypothetical protein